MPKPPRTAVAPLRDGSQAKPRRGATFFSDGLECHGPPIVSDASVTCLRFESFPFTSVGVVMNSYRSEEHTSELQSPDHLVCRLLLEKKKTTSTYNRTYVAKRRWDRRHTHGKR